MMSAASLTASTALRRHTVFVYGTLKQGGRLHSHLQPPEAEDRQCRYLGRDAMPDCQLYHVSWFPGVVPLETSTVDGNSNNDVVWGELYEVDTDTLAILDDVEGEGSLFRREVRRTIEKGCDAWIYMFLGEVSPSRRILSGIFDVSQKAA